MHKIPAKNINKLTIKKSWKQIINEVLQYSAHRDIEVPKSQVNHPLNNGFHISIGDFQGQVADYRLTLPDNRCIHVREFSDKYMVHWDYVSPEVDPVGHIIFDAPHWLIFIGIFCLLMLYTIRRDEK